MCVVFLGRLVTGTFPLPLPPLPALFPRAAARKSKYQLINSNLAKGKNIFLCFAILVEK
jgi:hypothetical protein